MPLSTAAAVITYISQFEKSSADAYRKAIQKFPDMESLFLSFARENEKYETNIKRSYYSVVSDALETGFCFQTLKDDIVVSSLVEKRSPIDALNASLEMEEGIIVFYQTGAHSAKALLPDVSRAMGRVAKSREERKKLILGELEIRGSH